MNSKYGFQYHWVDDVMPGTTEYYCVYLDMDEIVVNILIVLYDVVESQLIFFVILRKLYTNYPQTGTNLKTNTKSNVLNYINRHTARYTSSTPDLWSYSEN